MNAKNSKNKAEEERKEKARLYLEMIESKLRKAEKETWMVNDHDHLFKYQK